MVGYTSTRKAISRQFLFSAAAVALAVAVVASTGTWHLTHSGTRKSAIAMTAQVQQVQPQQDAVQGVAAPAPVDRTNSGSALDNSLVLVGSNSQAASVEQDIDQANALRSTMALTPLNVTVVVTSEQPYAEPQAIDAANALRNEISVPPLAVVDLR